MEEEEASPGFIGKQAAPALVRRPGLLALEGLFSSFFLHFFIFYKSGKEACITASIILVNTVVALLRITFVGFIFLLSSGFFPPLF